ncbi:hypothetical protein EMIHUDRAFT_365818 [Emiliania huxleyi CCMP1516]|uniref:Uncharacterized protein n=2 Tax=Emiliania huxleyi TaxID=2903 RepID=A0A0D3K1M8_EMIH1|nr:hypothetical protein EMIHUDRAFT_365818 [Emiliania huxleyi CCMP1516]EOD29663.1 hypothetical protein EMIHUDRAFT_365818 [Emiliania huxleyi CCMP1516]|eukprot:XP_005782092.1 hypothetical protein EMIHUDRAFT_365818 [Emiliania huxleyi CCMP1516]
MDGVAGAKERARGAPPRRPNVTASAAECYYLPHAWHKQELYHGSRSCREYFVEC